MSRPISKDLPEIIFGLNGSRLIALLTLVLVCFLAGLFFRMQKVKGWIGKLEDHVLVYLPGYSLMKAIAADTVGETMDHNMLPVTVKDGDFWGIGFLVEEGDVYCTVFFPDVPRPDAGEVKLVPKESVKKLNVPTNVFNRSIKNYGNGVLKWMKN